MRNRVAGGLLAVLTLWPAASGTTCGAVPAGDVTLTVDEPMPPPDWAVLERELLRANAAACREFFDH